MTQLSPRVQAFIDTVSKKHSPNFVVKDKAAKSGLYAAASFFARNIFNPKIDTDYATVIGAECWMPTRWLNEYYDTSLLEILAHETLHQRDHHKFGQVPFSFLYLLPQILAPLALLSILAIWFGLGWLACLGFLLLLLPLPAIGRMWLEIRAYRMNMLFLYFVHGESEENMNAFAKHFAGNFTGAGYYFMWPFEAHVVSMLRDTSHWRKDPIFGEVLSFLSKEGLLNFNRLLEAHQIISGTTPPK